MRIVHYINQFFGGKGSEEAADLEPFTQDEAVGPGKLLEQVLGSPAQVVRSLIVGDNFAAENLDSLTERVLQDIKEVEADLFVAGPCFEAGRYGVVAGALCAAVQAGNWHSGHHRHGAGESGVDLPSGGSLYCGLRHQCECDARCADENGRPSPGSKPITNPLADQRMKAISPGVGCTMSLSSTPRLNAWLRCWWPRQPGNRSNRNLRPLQLPPVAAPPPIADLSKAKVAIVTDGGLVPKGNPDEIAPYAATNWGGL